TLLILIIMYESISSKLAPSHVFRKRLIRASITSCIIMGFSLLIGVLGYRYLANLRWVDSFLNAAMILGGMGPVDTLCTDGAKLFAGFYALFSGVTFLVGMGVILTPMLHRFLHKFHLDLDDEEDKK
ncbi:MAG TPA: hypothetical protein VGK25_13870, partial [Ignavibacteria bacterium]